MEERILMMLPRLNEIQKRQFLASEAITYGRGGIAKVIQITGASRNTIKRGMTGSAKDYLCICGGSYYFC